jgi:hypothetical protein
MRRQTQIAQQASHLGKIQSPNVRSTPMQKHLADVPLSLEWIREVYCICTPHNMSWNCTTLHYYHSWLPQFASHVNAMLHQAEYLLGRSRHRGFDHISRFRLKELQTRFILTHHNFP